MGFTVLFCKCVEISFSIGTDKIKYTTVDSDFSPYQIIKYILITFLNEQRYRGKIHMSGKGCHFGTEHQ